MRLGELLIEEGRLRREQLEAALRTQSQYGGRLGSILVELGVLEVDVLAGVLAKQLGFPAATQKHFDALDRASLKLIPARTAEQRLAIPLGWSTRHDKTLIVAFADPRDLAAIDEVAFVTRARLQPCVAPEVRIRSALSRHYGLAARSPRFVAIDTSAPVPVESEPPPMSLPLPPVSQPTPSSRQSSPRMQLSMPPPSRRDMPAVTSPEPPPVSVERPRTTPPTEPRSPSLRPVLTLDEALATFELANHREEVGDTIADFLAMHFRSGLVLIVKDGAALGWKGFAPFVDREIIESLTIPLGSPSVIRTAFDTKLPWMGAPPADGEATMRRVYKLLRCEPPRTAVTVPVVVQTRVVNIVYGHGEPDAELAAEAIKELHIVCSAAADAYRRILRARVA